MGEHDVSIEPELHAKIAAHVRATGAFASVDEYVNFVLSELFGEPGAAERDEAAERKELLRRLKELGYA
jgi:Arc/MetJ-type ribon-helix-helix transcriptional regulator